MRSRACAGNSDQGSHFTSSVFTGILGPVGVRFAVDGRRRACDSIVVERLSRRPGREAAYLHDDQTVAEAVHGIRRYFLLYNELRPHHSAGYRTPAEVYGIPALRILGWDGERTGRPAGGPPDADRDSRITRANPPGPLLPGARHMRTTPLTRREAACILSSCPCRARLQEVRWKGRGAFVRHAAPGADRKARRPNSPRGRSTTWSRPIATVATAA